jgi:antagonist of KipI
MSIRILNPGLFDTVQDAGRYGLQHLGINPGGAADSVALAIANMLVGNSPGEAAIEMYYPAASILFENDALVAISGADFYPCINGKPIPINTPVVIAAGSLLEFGKIVTGCCCYISTRRGFQVDAWQGSFSTNIKAKAGGFKGRKLQIGDVIYFRHQFDFSTLLAGKECMKLGWRADVNQLYGGKNIIRVCKGHEYDNLDEASKNMLGSAGLTITPQTDRMGCRLRGLPLHRDTQEEMVSTGVTCGTIQLLPNGQLVVLMADHQTTGGYPRIAHVVSADIPQLAQQQPGSDISFTFIDEGGAEALLLRQYQYLQQLQLACTLRLEDILNNYAHH